LKTPMVGDRVKVTTPDNDDIEGIVNWMGVSQFTYVDDNHHTRFCMYTGVWDILKKYESAEKVNIKQVAADLYEEYQNYAAVARELDIHPTTVRTWLKSKKDK